ncbi:ATP-dependent acyl-CoA ligase [Variovorax dokdonensis]|uniref:ATP-dependent acyl-CoA ligase n=1 Tax=Variovorax dokdonensis TaxID=344883 RepID=A0ABT7N875_9BURK|nr:ATP-dependent acyl-CoA ligase [Variovorax dokdonensis]MDM0044141.1 ATP-dependent acyl-CoA ligase [Variovorax dokdonensis]
MTERTEPGAGPLPAAQRTLPAMLRHQAQTFGPRPALTIGQTRWTHGDVPENVARRAAALQQAGIGRGDRVALMCGNRIECLEAFLACGWIGAVAVPINTAAMGPQIEYFLANSGASLLVIEADFAARLQTADLTRCALKAIWLVGEGQAVPAAGVPCLPWPAAPQEAAEAADVGPGDTLAILYTSGTTGPSKGVLCPHAQYYWWGVHSLGILGVGQDDVLATTLPLFHINALNTFAQAALSGAEVVFLPRFSASGFWPAMRATGATVVYLLGAMVPILLAQPAGEGERGHRVRLGLGPGVPAAAAAEFQERTGVRLLEGYGSTETNFVIASRPDAPRGGVMGWLQPGFEARVADAHDAELPDGQAGELLLRASEPFAFAAGYFNMPDKTVEAWRNLWFHTGDRVVREADGAFRFIDRMKDAIRRRGENISSFEVEQVLLSHARVATVAVYPVQSELAEDEVMAAVIVQPGGAAADAQALASELAAWCESRLPYFAIPRFIDIVDDLPRTENGKVQKFKLRERGVTPTTWDRQPKGRRT